jgi:hypothetical protein
MITELHRRALVTTRPAGRGYLPLDFAPRSFRGRRSGGHLAKAGLSAQAPTGASPRQPEAAIAPPDVPLTYFTGGSVARRFHTWNALSGRRYICSVFPVKAEEPQASLPDFIDAIVIAVGVAADGLRKPLSFFECSEANSGDSSERRGFLAEALAQSVCEWHVHLLATDPELRRRVIQDLESAWFGENARPEPSSTPQKVREFHDLAAAC